MLWMQPFKRYFEFSGRSSRAEYWQFVGVVVVAIIIGALIDSGSASTARSGIPTLALIVMVGCMIPFYAATFRRLHDRGMSGWLVGLQWALNLTGLFVGGIKDSITSSILAAPFVLLYWIITLVELALAVYIIYQVAQPGEPDDNRFGPAPPA